MLLRPGSGTAMSRAKQGGLSVSAKHKRPFYVFAAVAAICCMVLVTGMRTSKAEAPPGPDTATLAEDELVIEDSGDPIHPRDEVRLALAVDARVRAAVLWATAGRSGDGSGSLPEDSGTPPPNGSDDPSDPGIGDIDGEPLPNAPGTGEPVDGGDSDNTVVETRPQGDEEQTGDESETTTPEDDTDTGEEEPDEEEPDEEETVGPLDDPTDDPSDGTDEGAGMDTDETPDEGTDPDQN